MFGEELTPVERHASAFAIGASVSALYDMLVRRQTPSLTWMGICGVITAIASIILYTVLGI